MISRIGACSNIGNWLIRNKSVYIMRCQERELTYSVQQRAEPQASLLHQTRPWTPVCGLTVEWSDNGRRIDRSAIILIILLLLRDSDPNWNYHCVETHFLVTHWTYLFSRKRNVGQGGTDRAWREKYSMKMSGETKAAVKALFWWLAQALS